MPIKGTSPAEILFIYALTLMICGALAYYASGYQSKAKSSLYVGNGSAVVCFLLAMGVRNLHLKKGEPGFIIMMICIHLAIIFPFVLGIAVSWRLILAWNNPEKNYVIPYFAAIVVASALTVATLYTFKPKRKPASLQDDTQSSVSTQDAVANGHPSMTDSLNTSSNKNVQQQLQQQRQQQQQPQSAVRQSSGHVVRKRARRATAM